MLKGWEKLWHGSVFAKFFISYMIVLLIPLAIGCISYVNSAQAIKNEMESYNLSLDMVRCLFFELAGTVIKILNEVCADHAGIFEQGFQPMAKLMRCKTTEEMRCYIESLLKQICCYVNSRKRSHNTSLKQSIIDYIDQYYMDCNISLTSIAGNLKLAPTYLSHLFKEQIGESMLDYLNMVRVAKAKELLKETRAPLSEIALKVGYTTPTVLIRAFKKYEGITPGQYRQMMQNIPGV